jgi:transposase
MEIFFKQLINKLDKERLNWRQHTILLLDNAPYHNSGQTLKMFDEYNIPIMFTGPHSYSAVPIETWFAHFKSVDINPERLPLGKS